MMPQRRPTGRIVEQEQDGGAKERDRSGLEMDQSREGESEDGKDNHRRNRLAHQLRIGDRVLWSRPSPGPWPQGRRHAAPQIRWMARHCTAGTTRMTGVSSWAEIHEGEMRRRADDDVGRIADQGRRAADIGGEDLGEKEGIGR